MWSEALRILDENSLKYYVEELKEELDQNDAEIAALKAQLEQRRYNWRARRNKGLKHKNQTNKARAGQIRKF